MDLPSFDDPGMLHVYLVVSRLDVRSIHGNASSILAWGSSDPIPAGQYRRLEGD